MLGLTEAALLRLTSRTPSVTVGREHRGLRRPFGVEGPRLALDRSPHAIPVRGPHHPADTRHSGPLAAEEEEEDTMGHGQAGAPDPVWMASSDPDADDRWFPFFVLNFAKVRYVVFTLACPSDT